MWLPPPGAERRAARCSVRAAESRRSSAAPLAREAPYVVTTAAPGSAGSPGQPISTTTRSGPRGGQPAEQVQHPGVPVRPRGPGPRPARADLRRAPRRAASMLAHVDDWRGRPSTAPSAGRPHGTSPTACCCPVRTRSTTAPASVGQRAVDAQRATRRPRWTRHVAAGLARRGRAAAHGRAAALAPGRRPRPAAASGSAPGAHGLDDRRDARRRAGPRPCRRRGRSGRSRQPGPGQRPPARRGRRGAAFMSTASLTSSPANPRSARSRRQHRRRQGRRQVRVERRQQHVRGHHRHRSGRHGGPERHQLAAQQESSARRVDGRQGEVRVDRGVAVPWEVLDAGAHAGRLQARDVRGRCAGRPAPGRHRSCAPRSPGCPGCC